MSAPLVVTRSRPARHRGLLGATATALALTLGGCGFLSGDNSPDSSATASPTTTETVTASPTSTGSLSPSESAGESPSDDASASPSASATGFGSPTSSESATGEMSPTASASPSGSPTGTVAGGLTDPRSLTSQLGAALVPDSSAAPAIHARGQGRATLVGDIPAGSRTLLVAVTCSPSARVTLRYNTSQNSMPSIIQPGQCAPGTLAATAIALPETTDATNLTLTVEVPGTTQFWVLAQPGT